MQIQSTPSDNGTRFLSDSFILYELQCSTDWRNGDLSSSQQSSLHNCVNTCDATAECITAVYAGNTCYLKKQLFESNNNPNTMTARRVFQTSLCQPNQGDKFFYPTFSSPALYRVGCTTDYFGGDISSVSGARLEDCIQACSTTDNCIGTTFHNDQCYLKSSFDGVRSNPSASSAVKALDCLTGASDGFGYPFPSGKKFTVKCGTTQNGGDMLIIPTVSLEDCLAACDAKSTCANVTWQGGVCKLKRSVPGASFSSGRSYWSAFLN